MKRNQQSNFLFPILLLTFLATHLGAKSIDRQLVDIDSLISLGNKNLPVNPAQAIELGLKAAELAEANKHYDKLIEANTVILNAYFSSGLMEEASYYASKNYQIAKDSRTEKDIVFAEVNLGSIWLALGKFEKSKEIFSNALEYMDLQPVQTSDSVYASTMAVILNNLALAQSRLNQIDKARRLAERGIEIAMANKKIPQEHVRLLNSHAEILKISNQLDGAKESLLQALSISKSINSIPLEAATTYSLASLFSHKKESDTAISLAITGLTLATKENIVDLQSMLTDLLFKEYVALNQPDSALKYRLMQEKTDSLIRYNSANEVLIKAELQNEFKKTLAAVEYEEKQKTIIFYGILSVSLIIIAYLIYLFLQSLKKSQILSTEVKNSEELRNQIAVENETLETELTEKNTELSVQMLKKLEKDKRIEELLDKLLATEKSPTKSVNLKEELKDLKNEHSLTEFDLVFTEVHSGFFKKLQTDFPNLTITERRICAMLKLQMTTKEIAQITRQSTRSIQMTRIRLRKKLNLTNQPVNLSDFLAAY